MQRFAFVRHATIKETAMADERIMVRKIHTHDRARAIAFVNASYILRFGAHPPESDIYFLAEKPDGTILGSIALDFCDAEKRIPLATMYTFSEEHAPFPTDGRLGAQLGRWITFEPRVSGLLMHAAACCALAHHKPYGWCENKPAIARTTRRLGITYVEIPEATLIIDAVPSFARAFYEETLRTTPMHLYMLSYAAMLRGLTNHGYDAYEFIA